MKINKLNYETYVIDYLEGQLSAEDRRAFEQFVASHPEVKAEMDEFLQGPILTEDLTVVYQPKAGAKKRGAGLYWVGGLALLLVLAVGAWMSYESGSEVVDATGEPQPVQVEEVAPLPMATDESFEKDGKEVAPSEITPRLETPRRAVKEVQPTIPQSPQQYASNSTEHLGKNTPRPKELYKAKKPTFNEVDILLKEDRINEVYAENEIDGSEERSAQAYVPATALVVADLPSVKAKEALPSLNAIERLTISAHFAEPRLIELVAVAKPKNIVKEKSKLGWRDILTPQSFEDIDLKSALVSQTLKSAVEDSEKAFVPEIFITK